MKFHKLITLIFFAGLLPAGCVHAPENESENIYGKKMVTDPVRNLAFRPNIIWLVARDVGLQIPSFGDSTVVTPNLDSLSIEGVRFTNVFSVSAEGASNRYALYTGLYPTGSGANNVPVMKPGNNCDPPLSGGGYEVLTPPEVKMLSQLLRENGYYCFVNDQENCQFTPPVTAWDDAGITAFWNGRNPGQPFFGIFYFDVTAASHINNPYTDAETRFDDTDFPEINPDKYSWKRYSEFDEWKLKVSDSLKVSVPPYLTDSESVRNDMRRMYSNILEMDGQVGNIIKLLKENQLLDSTMVCWFSDCGGPMPRQKGTLYEGGIHIPMIIRFPGKKSAGTYDDELTSLIDIPLTMLSVAGCNIPHYMQGQIFLGGGKSSAVRKYIFAGSDRIGSYKDAIRIARNKRYKYVNNFFPDKPYFDHDQPETNINSMEDLLLMFRENRLNREQMIWFSSFKPAEEFFDLKIDPYEFNNLINDSSLSGKISEFRSVCDEWLNKTGDMGHMPEEKIMDNFWPGGMQPKTENLSYSVVDQKIQLSCKTPGANIGYQVLSLDSLPGNAWSPYKLPLKIKANIRITAVAQRIGYTPGDTLMIEFR